MSQNPRYSSRSSSSPRQTPSLHSSDQNRWAAAAASIQDDYNGPSRSWSNMNDEPEDYNSSDWLDRKTKQVQGDSLDTSRRALGKLTTAQELAQSNLAKMAAQSGIFIKS